MADRNDPIMNSEEARRYAKEERLRAELHDAYNIDLRRVLDLPEGRRVLFHWLDESGVFGLVSSASGEETIKAAAVSDFGKRRLFEIQRADPHGFVKIMSVGMDELTRNKKENVNG